MRRILKGRHSIWDEVPQTYSVIHFKWQQNQVGFNYDKMIGEGFYLKEAVNQFEFHNELTSKIGLVRSLLKNQSCENTFQMLPLVFVLNFEERGWEVDIASFVEYYNAHCPGEQ